MNKRYVVNIDEETHKKLIALKETIEKANKSKYILNDIITGMMMFVGEKIKVHTTDEFDEIFDNPQTNFELLCRLVEKAKQKRLGREVKEQKINQEELQELAKLLIK